MKEMKRILSLFLCLAMLVGYMPVGVLAAEDESATEPSVTALVETTEAAEETTVPETTVPETTVPETTVPETTVPETTVPETTVPETTVPETTVPETTVPETTVPETTVPVTTAPETTEATQPEETAPVRKPVKKGATKVKKEATGAQDATKDYLFLATDFHDDGDIIDDMIGNMEANIGAGQLDYLGLGGMAGAGHYQPEYDTSDILEEITEAAAGLTAANVDIVAGIHDKNVKDDAEIVLPYSADPAQIYEGTKFYVYGVPESSISGGDEDDTKDCEAMAKAFVDWANGSDIDKTKAIIVLSCYPLHRSFGDNPGAACWAEALNTVAAGSDAVIDRNVAFFWGHNIEEDSEIYFHITPNETIPVEGASEDVKIYFTYANAGYLKDMRSATLVTITESTITFDKYVGSSIDTTNSVNRVVPSEEPEETDPVVTGIQAVSNKEVYYVGDELDITVHEVYSDGSKVQVEDYKTEGFDNTKTGTQSVTVTYGSYTVVVEVKVEEKVTEPTVTGIQAVSNKEVYYVGDELDITVHEVYSDGSKVQVEDYKTEGFDNTKTGTQSVTVTYGSYTVVVEVKVEEKVTEPTVTGIQAFSNKVSYAIGEPLDIIVYAEYSDETIAEVTPDKVEGFDSSVAGVCTVVVTYGEFSVTLSLTVEDPVAPPALVELKVSHSKQSLLNQELVLTVVAVYDDGSIRVLEEGEYTVQGYDPAAAGTQGVIVTYENQSCGFDIANVEGVSVLADGMSSMTVTNVTTDDSVVAAAEDAFTGEFFAYDITPDAYNTDSGRAVVSMPAPEGANVVYYLNEQTNALERVTDAAFRDGKVVFTTNHFSIYIVGEDTRIELTEGNYTYDNENIIILKEKTVYVLTDTITAGNSYLIANSGSASTTTHYLLSNISNGVGSTDVIIKSKDLDGDGTDEIYIELDNAANSLWEVGGTNTYNFKNGGYYLSYSNGLQLNGNQYTNWTYNNNRLSYTYDWGYSRTVYLGYTADWWGNYNWRATDTQTNVYFYVPTEITEETLFEGVTGVSKVVGDPINLVVAAGATATAELKATLTFKDTYSGLITTEDVSTTADYEIYDEDENSENGYSGDPLGIIADIDGNKITFTGEIGNAVVRVSCKDIYGKDVHNYIQVTTTAPYYDVEITDDESDEVLGERYTYKSVTAESTFDLGAKVAFVTAGGEQIPENVILVWTVESGSSIATIDQDGILDFTGEEGPVTVRVTYTAADGKQYADKIIITATKSNASTDVTDYPVWGQPGSVRYDKTATAVGDFSKTGVAQIELSMAGIPSGGAIDVVMVLDTSGSMGFQMNGSFNGDANTTRLAALKTATKNFIDTLYAANPQNRFAIIRFDSYNKSREASVLHELGVIEDLDDVKKTIDDITTVSGTAYSRGLSFAWEILKDNNEHAEYLVFLSDGAPDTYEYINGVIPDGSGTYPHENLGNNVDMREEEYPHYLQPEYAEYYSTLIKEDGVTVYSVGVGTLNTNEQKLLANMSSNETHYTSATNDGFSANLADYFYMVTANNGETGGLDEAFQNIASEINAASNVVVQDVISNDYEITFDWPSAVFDVDRAGYEDGFYLEVVKYGLGSDNERDGSYEILQRVYVTTDNNGNLSGISKIQTGSKAAGGTESVTEVSSTLTFTAKAKATDKAYYVYNETDRSWIYKADGSGTHHMQTGAVVLDGVLYTPNFVYNSATKLFTWTVTELTKSNEMALRYFVYLTDSMESLYTPEKVDKVVQAGPYYTNAYAKMSYTNHLGHPCEQIFPVPQLTWNGAQVSYVFYLVNKEGQPVNRSGEVVTSFNEAVFVTDIFTESVVWNGTAAVAELDVSYYAKEKLPAGYTLYDPNASYTIYVHKSAGDNNTDNIYNYFVIEGSEQAALNAAHGVNVSDVTSTKVYNTKAGTKYVISKFDDEGYPSYELNNNTVLYSAYSTDVKTISHVENGVTYTYDKVNALSADDFNYGASTVAFAVTWEIQLTPDTVVVDYGLPVHINVVDNDFIYNYVTGITADKPEKNLNKLDDLSYKAETGTDIKAENLNYEAVLVGDNIVRFTPKSTLFKDPVEFYYETQVEYYAVDNTNVSTKYTPYMYSSVTVIPATTVYYEDSFLDLDTHELTSYEEVTVTNQQSLYEKVHYTKDGDNYVPTVKYDPEAIYYLPVYTSTPGWETDGTTQSATQAQDRPGAIKITEDLDANNIYGYDKAYSSYSDYSLGSTAMISVNAEQYGTASFSFYGTGFDVIGVTSNITGALIVDVYEGSEATGTPVRSRIVDTFYGYEYRLCNVTYRLEDGQWVRYVDGEAAEGATENRVNTENAGDATELKGVEYAWIVMANESNTLYQVPVMKVAGLDYKQYTVVINAFYDGMFDHNKSNDYNLYLDAIRIYDPTGNQNDDVNEIYKEDHEAWPVYQELRNNVIAASDFENHEVNGVVFIDCADDAWYLEDYISYGPNNELYLAPGQAVAFALDLSAFVDADGNSYVDRVHLGMKSANGNEVNYTLIDANEVNDKMEQAGDEQAAAKAFEDAMNNADTVALTTATDMYYDLTDLKDNTVIVYNKSGGILSLTNIKVTFTQDPGDMGNLFYTDYETIQNILDVEKVVTPDVPEEDTEPLQAEAKLPTLVKTGDTFEIVVTAPEGATVTIKTGEDEIDAEGESTPDGYTYTAALTASETAGAQEVMITVEYNGATATLKAEVTVYEYKPDIEITNTPAKVGQPTTITVTTGTDVAAVRVDDQLLTTYRVSGGQRIWTTQVTFDVEDEVPVTVIAYSEEGYESDGIEHTIVVTENTQTVAQTVRNIVSSIAKTLLNWFKK